MQKRIEELDILRGMAILGVVVGHTAAESLYVKITLLGILFNQVFRFAVPAFIFLSGIGLSLSQKPYPGYIRFTWYRIRKIVPLYFLWTIVYLFPLYLDGRTFPLNNFSEILFTGGASYHLYFLPLIVQLYLLFPFLYKYFRRTSGVLVSLVITLVLQIAHNYLTWPGWLLFKDQRIFLNWLFYFVLGIWSAPRIIFWQRKLGRKQSVIFISFLLCLAGLLIEANTNLSLGKGLDYSLTHMRPSVILYSLVSGVWILSYKAWPNAIKSFFRFFSIVSYEIYLAHVFVLNEFNSIFIRTGISKATLTYGIAAFLSVLFFSVLIVLVQRYLFKSHFPPFTGKPV